MGNGFVDKIYVVNQLGQLFTEDEWNNLLIDMWVAENEREKNVGKPISAIAGETVTITLTDKNYYQNPE